MKIQDMFEKDITRDLDGVIVVSEEDPKKVKQELEEYVVTRDMATHFRDFFEDYKKGIIGKTTKTGAWISGFFGSGKSHFLKMLAYILENKVVDGKNALQYFIDNNQIKDNVVLADMELAAGVPTDVILFNIDSKSDQGGKQTKDSITAVFLKVFNEMQGFFGSMPYIADLEKMLKKKGLFDEFQRLIEGECGESWINARNDFDFIQDSIVDVLVKMNYMSESAARNWCEKASEPYSISTEEFAKRVKDYLDSKEDNRHIVFMVDEVGQYIGDDSHLMLNLQTIREDLGRECQGRAWVVVTSQEDIDSITDVKGNDFSKIKGRFDTKLSITSANVGEVIRERILRKNDVAAQTLRVLYDQVETKISNLITFENVPEMKLYESRDDFSAVYPFIPYQFNLLTNTLTSIRMHSASGKHLSEGARSMLALFKESAEAIKDEEQGILVSFYRFYDALEGFLDSSHKSIIQMAMENKNINPEGADDCFAVNVLKCLFLIKYVKEMENATLENITTLMISNIDEERGSLSEKVEKALNVLIKETLVQKHNNTYTFLTRSEQEVIQAINSQSVEVGEVISKISDCFYDGIFSEKSYKYSKFSGRYVFSFNRITDETYYKGSQNYEIGVRLFTPFAKSDINDTYLHARSNKDMEVLIALPDDKSYIDEMRQAIKIEKYLRVSSSSDKNSDIKKKKEMEMEDCKNNAKLYLIDCLKNATIYVNGDKVQSSSSDISSRINEALERLVGSVYHKLYYINKACSADDIRSLFTQSNQASVNLEGVSECNADAQNEVLSFIKNNTYNHTKASIKSLKDKFMKAPFGFIDDDVQWIVARLYKKGDINLYLNGKQITTSNTLVDDIVKYITKKEYVEKLMSEYREKVSDDRKRVVRDLIKELFGVSCVSGDEDDIRDTFIKNSVVRVGKWDNYLKFEYKDTEYSYPGRQVVESGIRILKKINNLDTVFEFYSEVSNSSDALKKFAEDFEPIEAFFNGEQRNIFDETARLMCIFDDSKSYIDDEGLKSCATSMREILKEQKPFKDIPKLPELNSKFSDAYKKLLEKNKGPVKDSINNDAQRVMNVLSDKPYTEEFRNDFISQFKELTDGVDNCNNISTLLGYASKSGALRIQLLSLMDKKDEEFREHHEGEYSENTPVPKVHNKTISIKSIVKTSSWHIETKTDIDECVEDLRKQLEKEIEDNTIINIEF